MIRSKYNEWSGGQIDLKWVILGNWVTSVESSYKKGVQKIITETMTFYKFNVFYRLNRGKQRQVVFGLSYLEHL